MTNGSHSRHTTKFDQRPTNVHCNVGGRDITSATRQAMKKLQKRKQRQYDKKLCLMVTE